MPTVIHAPPLDDVAHATSSDYLASNHIPANADLNNYTMPGVYYNSYDEEVATITNTPANKAFSLFVENHAGLKQTFVQYDNSITWVRNKHQNTWGSWIEQSDIYVGPTAPSGNYRVWIDTSA